MDFLKEPPHSSKLYARSEHPWNAEPDVAGLVRHPITPDELVYCRNHCPVKSLDTRTFTVKVEGLVKHQFEYTLDILKQQFRRKEIVASLQCAGNRRKTMQEKKRKEVEGVLWEEGTISNCRWAGVDMRELLLRAGAPSREDRRVHDLHLCFASHVVPCQDDDWFGASIPLEKALDVDGDVLLAHEINGRSLSCDHGFPLRVVVPGYTGARWVKWVDQITVAQRESENFYQQKDYKILPAKVQTHEMADKEDWWSKVPPILANRLNSVVASVNVVWPDTLHVAGYAVRGSSGQVVQVEVSLDEGKSWQLAAISYQEGRWSWTLWEALIALPEARKGGGGKVWSRAIDESGETQQPDMDWNLRGVAFSAIGEKDFDV